MALGAIGAIAGAMPSLPSLPTTSVGTAGAGAGAGAVGQAGGQGFGDLVGHAVESLSATQNKADGLALQAATGTLTDVHDYTIAATEASLATELTVAVRNKAVEAFNDIMRMGI